MYRYERSGVMHGLLRVRGFTQDDAHIFCTPEQIEEEIAGCLEFALDVLKDFGFEQIPDRAFHLESGRPQEFCGQRRAVEPRHAIAGESAEAHERSSTRPSPAKRRFTGRRSTSSWWMRSGGCGSFRPCSSTSTCRSASAWNTSPKMASRKQPVMVHRALYRVGGALLRRADRALCRRVSGVAVAGAGGDDSDQPSGTRSMRTKSRLSSRRLACASKWMRATRR